MDELLKALPSLIGVVIGGLITFIIQQVTIRKQQNWDKRKLELENAYENEEKKFNIYNMILQLNGKYEIIEHDMHYGPVLNQNNYTEHIRPLLFEIFHLLDDEMVVEINNIEDIYERQFVMEEAAPGDKEDLSNSYLTIIKLIKKDFKQLRESKKTKKKK